MEECLESSLYQQANKFQQIFYEVCSDYHTFYCADLNEGIEHLKNFIGYTLFGLQLPAYKYEQIQIIEKLYDKIIENSNAASTIYCGLIFNVMYFTPNRGNAHNCIYPVPIFKIGNVKTCNQKIKDDTDLLNITYIDIGGRVYNNWQEYLAKNTLKNMTMILPYNGIYSLNPAFCSGRFTSSVHIEKILSQTTNDPNYIMKTNCHTEMTEVSGGVNILLGGCWQNSSMKDHMEKNLSMYITIDNIIIHGLLDTFDPPTMNENYINYGELNGTDLLKLSKHIMYIGNCIVPEEILKNFLVDPNNDNILFEYEAQLREVRHTTEHQHKHKDASNNIKKNNDQNKLIIRELRTIKIREEILIESIIYNIKEIINCEDPFKLIKFNPNEESTEEIKEQEPAGELMDNSLKPYVGKVLECLRKMFGYVDMISSSQTTQLLQLITGFKSLGMGFKLFVHVINVVSNIVNAVHPEKLEYSIAVVFIQALDIFFNYFTLCVPFITRLMPGVLDKKSLYFVIEVSRDCIKSKIHEFANLLAQKIRSYCNSRTRRELTYML